MKVRHVFWSLLWVVQCGVAFAQTPVVGQALVGLESFDEWMLSTLAKHDYPGGALAVSYQGRLVLNKAYGYAKKSAAGNTAMAVDQRMRIASMSKWITGAAALKAAEMGKLNLDQPLAEILAWSLQPTDYADPRVLKITVRQLLQNHAGWTIDRANDPMFERVPPCPGSAQRWASRQKLDADPGQLYSYSNINFCLAQLALEKATGQSYGDFVKTQLAQPLGITTWQLAAAAGGAQEPEYFSTAAPDSNPYNQVQFDALGAAGAWTSSASDYVRFLAGLRGQAGVALLAPSFAVQMTGRPQAADSVGKPVYYGMGTNVRDLGGGRFNAWHHGSLAGTTSYGASYANGWSLFVVFNRRLPREVREAASLELDRGANQAISKSGRPEGEIRP